MCSAIPHGKVSTYGAMAKALQSAPRAVGQVTPCPELSALMYSSSTDTLRLTKDWFQQDYISLHTCGKTLRGPLAHIKQKVLRSSRWCHLTRPDYLGELLDLQALRRNPFAPEVPCHRVVAANLELGGFGGDWVSKSPKYYLALLLSHSWLYAGLALHPPKDFQSGRSQRHLLLSDPPSSA